MFKLSAKVAIVLVCVFVAFPGAASADETAKATSYLKLTPGKSGQPARLETAVVRFQSIADPSLVVDLVGVIHVGDKAYYERLNEHMKQYEIVLYEWVGPKGERPKGKGGYSALAKAMKLVDQGEVIDYQRGNFVHADMSGEQFQEAFKKRGLKQPRLGLQVLFGTFLFNFMGPDQARAAMASGLSREPKISGDPVIIGDRNEVVMEVLAEQLQLGRTNVAIFYGALHMRDFEQRLFESYGLIPLETQWFTVFEVAATK